MIRRISFLLVAAWLSSAAHAALVFGPERAISRIEYGSPLGPQRPSGLASDGNGFLAVWSDSGALERQGIYAAPISAAGEIRPESQILIRRAGSGAMVAWNGESYVVFWTESSTLMMARLSREGRLITAPQALYVAVTAAAVASNGTNVLVAYLTAGTPRDLRVFTLDRSGTIVSDVLIASGGGSDISAASDGDSFVVIWNTNRQIMAARLSSRGSWLGQRELLAVNAPASPTVAYGAGTYEVVLRVSGELQAISVDASTLQPYAPVKLDSTGFEPVVVFNGSEFVALWYGTNGPRSAVIDPHAVGPPSIVSPSGLPSFQTPFLASNGQNLFAVWLASDDVVGTLLDGRGQAAVTAPGPVALAPVTQIQPMLAASDRESYLVWKERADDLPFGRVMAARIDSDGTVAAPLVVTDNAWIAVPPQIVFTGSAYFVAWAFMSGSQLLIAGRLLDRDGTLGPEIQFGPGSMPGLASNGTVTLIAFTRPPDMVGVRLTDRGSPIDPTPLIIASRQQTQWPGTPFPLGVASNGSDFLVTWTEGSDYWQFPSAGYRDIYGARVMSNGSADATAIAIAAGGSNQYAPAVASDGRDYVIAYEIDGMMTGLFRRDGHIAAKRVLREGQVADADGPVLADGRVPQAARDADGYVVAFYSTEGVRVVQLDANASQRSSVMIPMSGASDADILAQAGRTFLVYTRPTGESGTGVVQRAFIRVGSEADSRRRSARH